MNTEQASKNIFMDKQLHFSQWSLVSFFHRKKSLV